MTARDSESLCVGIDLGTTFSAVACMAEDGRPLLLTNSDGDALTPSVVLFDGNKPVVGRAAQDDALAYPGRVARLFKRHIGDDMYAFVVDGHSYSATDLSAMVLADLRRTAEMHLGSGLPPVVITVPAYFGDPQRRATLEAARIAGLEVRQLLNEPTAAGYAFGLHRRVDLQRVLVFDLGGGTFDVTVMEVSGDLIEVKATGGDHQLGGADWDEALAEHLSNQLATLTGHRLSPDEMADTGLMEQAVRGKLALSSMPETKLLLHGGGKSLRVSVTREEFERLTGRLLERCRLMAEMVVEEASWSLADIDRVLLVGGATRMPAVRAMLLNLFGKAPSCELNPDEAVAMGAAVKAALLTSTAAAGLVQRPGWALSGLRDVNVTSHGFGVVVRKGETLYNSIIIPKNTPYPCEKSRSDYGAAAGGAHNAIRVVLTEGEDEDPYRCNLIGHYEAYGLPAGSTRRRMRLQFTYRYNANQVVEIEAHDLSDGRPLPIRALPGKPKLSDLYGPTQLDVVLVLDCSDSMSGSPLSELKSAATAFVRSFSHPKGRIALVTFPRRLVLGLDDDRDDLERQIGTMSAGGGTPMAEGLGDAMQILGPAGDHDAQRVVIVMSDGAPDRPVDAQSVAGKLKDQGVRLITVGVRGADEGFLRGIASSVSDYHRVGGPIELTSVFVNLAEHLTEAGALSRSEGE